jgi:protocatechuate 3,4-dioxygenase beta subunit
VASAYVDQDGAFQTQGLAPGKYKIQFFAPYPSNLLDEWYNDKRSSAEATVVELVTPGTDATANATLDQGSVLSGTVTAADGSQPLSDVGVSIYSRDGNHSSYARTHSDGKYTTSRALPPGEYRISFYSYDREYLGEYYNNKANASEADWVTLTLGTDEEINAALDKASHLVGKVTDPQGQPVANVQVRAYTNDYEYHGSSTDENGNYDIGGLRAGSYTLRFTPSEPTDLAPEWWNNQTDEYSADAIDLGAQQTLTNNVALDRGAVITGTVRDAQNRPVEGVTVKASGAESETAVTGADGTYRLVGLEAGSYRVRFKPLGDLTGQWYDGVDTKDGATLINLTSGQSQDGVDARLRTARTVGGTVIDPDGNPVSDVRIEIYAKGKSYYADRTVTDDQGTFRSHDLPAGDYDLYVRPSSPTRFASQWYDKAVTRSAATPVKVSDSQPATVTVKLEPGAEITGTVTGQGGTPIPGAYVSAERDRDYRYTQTDSAGNYTITGLTTGSYKVLFEPDTSEHVSEWYNNEESVEDADPVDVTQGRTTAGIDAQLARAGSISGTIRNSDGGPVAYSYVMAYRGDQQAGWSWVGSDGRYSFSGLRAGTYTMHSWGSGEWVAQWWNNKPDQASADRITLAAGEDLTGKDFTLSRGASISGTVKDSNGQTIDGYVELTDSDGEEYAGADVDNGAYSMVGLPAGTYYLQFQSYGSDWVSEWWQDKPDRRTATPITLSAGQVRSGFDAVLSQASKIRGTMIDGQGRAVRGCVTVFLTGSDDWAGSDCTDASGHYVVGGLRAGNYQVRFDPSSDKFARQWWNGAPRRAMASTITLGDASEAVADATLLAGGTLTGVVTDDAGDPVGGVQVRAYTQESYYETATVTDVHGRYVMQGLDDEDYRVQAAPGSSRLDLAGEWYDDKVNYATATVVPVQNGSTVTASFELEKGASISGKVSDESGPVSGIGVDVFDLDGNKSLTVWTDADGDYTSTALKPGQYKVRFMPGYYGGDGLVEQWWNNKNTEATANIIALSAKQQKTGVDATLRAIGPGNTAPGAPTDVQVTPGDKQVTVRWKAPPNDGGLPITRYVVEGTQDSGCVTLGNLVCMIEDLDNGESYTFTVKASNSVGLSPASTPSASVIPFGKPKPPTAVKATAGTEKATVSWTPGGDNGRAISGYTVTSSPSGKTCQTAATTCEVTGLTGGTSYTFTVKATNIAGNSADSAASNAVTPVANPTPPITPPTTPPPPGAPPQDPPPGGEPVNPGGGTQPPAPPAAPSAPAKVKAKSKSRKLAVSWSPVSGATKYQVRVNKGSKKGAWKTVSKPKYTSGKLKKGKYTVEVKAVGAGGGGPAKKVTVKVK